MNTIDLANDNCKTARDCDMRRTISIGLKSEKLRSAVLWELGEKYNLTQNEIEVLIFLHNNPDLNTSKDIVKYRWTSKSLVCKSVRSLLDNEYLDPAADYDDGRIMRLNMTDKCKDIAKDLAEAEKKFYDFIFSDITFDYTEESSPGKAFAADIAMYYNNYINNEVATDYNAGFTGLLCKMVDKYGGKSDPSFPQPEARDAEFFVEATLKQSSSSGVSLSLKLTNHTAWPARVVDGISYRYYFDASEIISAGYSATDVVVRVDRDQATMYGQEYAAKISPITQYKDNIYYIEVAYPNGEAVLPISEGRHQCETMLALVFPNYGNGWDAENDYSNADIMDTLGSEDGGVVTDKITVYDNGVLIYGVEPDGTKPDVITPTKPAEPEALKGDVNVNGTVEVADVVLLSKYLLGTQTLKSQQFENADMTEDNKVNIFDLVALKRTV